MQRIAKYGRAVIALVMVSMTASIAAADWNSFWHNFHVDKARNNAWPDPFNEIDAMQVVAPFEVMKRNGWRLHHTIGNELFRKGDGALMAAGHRHVHWIATQAPPHRRQIHVLQGSSEAETQARLASVKSSLDSYSQQYGPKPTVMVTTREPSQSNGAQAMQINRSYLEEMPPPKLPSTSAAGTASATQQ